MSTSAAHPAQALDSKSIVERYFQISLYLLIATGFFTLAGTGKLDLLSLIFIATVLVTRGALLARNRSLTIPERWTNYATLAYIVFYAVDFFFISGSFVNATVHLVLFSMAVKIFSVQRERDHFYLAVLSFLMVLAAAILTVDSTFLFSFILFLVLATATFVSMEMRRSAGASVTQARLLGISRKRLARSLSLWALLLVCAILLGSFLIFLILPRLSGGYLNALAQNNEFVTGFSNDVELGRIGEIKQSSTIVMHVEIYGDKNGSYTNLLWRGVALSQFDGKRWINPFRACDIPTPQPGYFQLNLNYPHSSCFQDQIGARGLQPLHYRVLMEPIGTNALFLAPMGVQILGRYNRLGMDANGSVTTLDQPISIYDGVSNIASPSVEKLRAATSSVPAGIKERYASFSYPLDARIPALATTITAKARNDYDKASAIQEYLKFHYGYTLQLPKTLPDDPVANFLFERKEGHCEYFASAMAIMLRSLGIPSRVVNGFRGGQFNDLTSSYIIRASSAHTWVEAYFQGYGWVTFDPTPADPKPTEAQFSRVLLYLDAMSEFWREWIINYDLSHQLALDSQVLSHSRHWANDWRASLRARYHVLLSHARDLRFELQQRRYGIIAVVVILLLLLTATGKNLWQAWRKNRIASQPSRAPSTAASIWYERMLRTLARCGFQKRPSQTPQEFVSAIAEPKLQGSVARFTRHYESARFGDVAEDAEHLPEDFKEIEELQNR